MTSEEQQREAWEAATEAEYDKYFMWSLVMRPGETPMSFIRFRAVHIVRKIDPRDDVQRPS